MPTLVLRFNEPLQSWGARSRYRERDTMREPTKSGVIGLLANALGRVREDSLEDLASLQMTVRVDREGVVVNDFQTAGADLPEHFTGFPKSRVCAASGEGDTSKPAAVYNKLYLSDADFLVSLWSNNESFMAKLKDALEHPARPLFVGRRSCPVGGSIVEGIYEGDPMEILIDIPWIPRDQSEVTEGVTFPRRLVRVVTECAPGHGEVRYDVPIRFVAPAEYSVRYVRQSYILVPEGSRDQFPGLVSIDD